MAEYETLRQRHLADLAALLPEHTQRLHWPAERLGRERRDHLRDLLRVARSSSPWHRDRLAGVDPDSFEETDLAGLPPMTKDDLMANWDAVVTDRRLTLDLVEDHLAGLESDAYLFDEFHAVASGGSSGRRGIYVFGWRAWATGYAGFMRPTVLDRAVTPELAAAPMRIAMVGARNATHMTSAMPQTFANPAVDVALFPVTRPLGQIVAGLNDYQPLALMGYPSMLTLLAAEARAGRLRILPRRITTTSEPLLPEARQALTETFCAPVANMYGTSEAGPVGVGCFRGPGIHLCDDLVIVEPVDLDGRPVPPGVRSDKVYVTAITNTTLPLIRFELTDQVTVLKGPCPCGSAHTLVADVEGRLDDVFTYPGGQLVHPHVFGSVLRRDRGIVEYQVRQTPAGAEVLVVGAPADPPAIARRVAAELAGLGVPGPAVEVRVVDQLERQPTGKVRRFRPLEVVEVSRPG
ncbi:MAG TPA: phenylacetate--CoA ligase family protein [Actinomycetes bacterium]|nr:phenylacetate--CoA ligase family protein [Actinomycetes bacterium]